MNMQNENIAIEVLDFWWSAGTQKWYMKDPDFDEKIRIRFSSIHKLACSDKLNTWTEAPHTNLALILILDQFSRNIYRDNSKAFSADSKAIKYAKMALSKKHDMTFPAIAKQFFYLPFMHSENIQDQETSVTLFRKLGEKENYFYSLIHFDAIHRFGRFPHRNKILNRTPTDEEIEYLETGGFSA
jgi:uncharacterized protein (DUF924 family)